MIRDVVGVVKNIGVRMTKIQSYGTIISINNSDLKAMQNMSYADSRITCSIKIDSREDLYRVRKVIERELPERYTYVFTKPNEELVTMCQRNGIRLAVSRSLLEQESDRSEEKPENDREKTD